MQEHNTQALFHHLRRTLQEAHSSWNGLSQTLIQQIKGTFAANTRTNVELSPKQQLENGEHNEEKENVALHVQMEAWKQDPSWTDHPPLMKVEAPKGTLCHIESIFQLGMPPDALFNIVTDPENKRVFKNIKEVTYRRVLEDEGHRQLVEVEQSAIWRFLCFSGLLSIRVFVDQDRRAHKLKFHLAKEGFMKKFEGSWDIKPVYIDSPHCELLASPEDDPVCCSSRIASKVLFKQIVQPIVVPPPPLSWYVRGISRKQTESLIEDLQTEAKRLREGDECKHVAPQQDVGQLNSTTPTRETEVKSRGLSPRKRRRNSSWLRKASDQN